FNSSGIRGAYELHAAALGTSVKAASGFSASTGIPKLNIDGLPKLLGFPHVDGAFEDAILSDFSACLQRY
ncbi:hypothetical protein, partial [Congregibacter sp.]|uniref:hypothetical protein n=1 Tax=Congregibacter sp. TaxID=2744308 RepID=UPI003F6C831E